MEPRMFGGHFGQHGIVRAHELPAARVVEKIEQFTFAAPHALGTSGILKWHRPMLSEQAVVGFGDGGQSCDFAAGAGAHLDDAELNLGSHRQQSERHADVVVEVAAGGVDGVSFGQYTADEFFGRRFAVAARYGDEGCPMRVGVHGPSPATPATCRPTNGSRSRWRRKLPGHH